MKSFNKIYEEAKKYVTDLEGKTKEEIEALRRILELIGTLPSIDSEEKELEVEETVVEEFTEIAEDYSIFTNT